MPLSQDDGPKVVDGLVAGSGQGGLAGYFRGAQRHVSGIAGELLGDGPDDCGLGAPRPADDDELGVGQGHDGGQDSADGFGHRGADPPGVGIWALNGSGQGVGVDGGGAGVAEVEFGEDVGEMGGSAPWTTCH